MSATIDLTPSPRVLRMLGQIDFQPWQCLAELIDNSIDAFLDGKSGSKPATLAPSISIELPTQSELEQGTGAVVVRDNGPGMTESELALAVKAGYSGNDPVEKLGLFGMGFNIATARLGRRTVVRSTTTDMDHWIEVEIDFDNLERTKTFAAPLQRRHKTAQDIESGKHGTEVIVQKLEPQRIRPLIIGRGKGSTRIRLGKIYGRVMNQLGIEMLYGGEPLKARLHCTWDPSRSVPSKSFQTVPAIIKIEEALDEAHFCNTCWVWLTSGDNGCPACGTSDNVITRRRTIRGWIGIQRYFSKDHYGIDLIRNGRVIEELDKSLFNWVDPATFEKQLEYPLDTTHWGGRIVGELEIDFVRVSHQKDAFDKLDPEWNRVVEKVRGTSPLRPQIAQRMGMPANTSPLARLYSAYRSGSEPGLSSLVPGRGGKGINDAISEWVDKFYEGDPDYQTDEKWYALVLEAEEGRRGPGSKAERKAAGKLPIANSGVATTADHTAPAPPIGINTGSALANSAAPAAKQVPDEYLSRTFQLDLLPGTPSMEVRAFRVTGAPDAVPLTFHASNQDVTFVYNADSPFFEQSLTTAQDCLVRDLAARFILLAGTTQEMFPVAIVEAELLKKYFPEAVTSTTQAVQEARDALRLLREHLSVELPAKAPVDLSRIPAPELEKIRKAMIAQGGGNEAEVEATLRSGAFAKFVSQGYLVALVGQWPDLVMDGRLLSNAFADVAPDLRQDSVEVVLQTYKDVLWLTSENGGEAINKDNRWRLRYARALASLRLLQSWRA